MRNMMKETIETLSECQLEAHLSFNKNGQNASLDDNGHISKKVKYHVGEMEF